MQIRRRIAVATTRPGLLFSLVMLGTLILDQVSKFAVRAKMDPGDTIVLISGVFDITYVRNIGGAFGVLAGYRYLFIGVMVFVVIGVAIYWYRMRPDYVWMCISLGLIVAGAIGNAIDRVSMGPVTDFIDVFGSYFAVFNVADAAVVVGVLMLLTWIFLAPEDHLAQAADFVAVAGEDSAETFPEDGLEAPAGEIAERTSAGDTEHV